MPQPHRIHFHGDIGWDWTAQRLVSELQAAQAQDIELCINCPGGDVLETFALASVLRRHPGRKVAVVDGICASGATLVAVSCDEVRMNEASLFMIHDPWGVAVGRAEDLDERAELLRKERDLMIAMYCRKSGQSEEQVRAWCSAETWFKPEEAKAAGFCDAIVAAPARIDARVAVRHMAKWRHPPPSLLASAKPSTPSPQARPPVDRKQIILNLAAFLAATHETAAAAAASGDTELADIGNKMLTADKLPELVALIMPLAQKEGGADATQAREILRTYAAAVKLTGKTEGVPGALDALAQNAALKVTQTADNDAAKVEQLLAQGRTEFKLTPEKCEEWRAALKGGNRTLADLRSFVASALPAGNLSADPVEGKPVNNDPQREPSPLVKQLTDWEI